MNNQDLQETARKLATQILENPQYSFAETVQGFLGGIADNQHRNPHFAELLEMIVQHLFEALEPEQVIL